MDALDVVSMQEREDLTASAQVSVRYMYEEFYVISVLCLCFCFLSTSRERNKQIDLLSLVQ